MEKEKTGLPECDSDCFASKNGRCRALSDNDFGGRSCPFYKQETADNNRFAIEADIFRYQKQREVDAWQLEL